MPCIAPSRNNLKAQGPCAKPTLTFVSGVDVSAESLCLFHWEMKNGLVPGSAADSSTSLLLHCDGADAATTFLDSSPIAKPVTALGTAQIDTAQSKFSGASALFDGIAPTSLAVADHPDFNLGAGDFTIDFWARPNTILGGHYLLSKMVGGFGAFAIFQNAAGVYFYAGSTGTTWDLAGGNWFGDLVAGTWQHLAAVRSGGMIYVFRNGVQPQAPVAVAALPLVVNTAPVTVGGGPGGGTPYDGWLDEFRISKGLARWTSNFSPPTAPY